MPRCPGVLLFLTCALLGIGGWMVINSRSIYDSDLHALVPLRNFAPHLPGSVDHAISAAWMIRAGVLLGATLLIADLSQSDRWYLRLWWVVGFVAGSIAFLGLLQKATGAQMIFWRSAPPWGVSTFFATFYYHANAGAFLNLVWPLTAGLALRSFTQRRQPAMRGVWVSMFVLTVAAVLANTSRVAQLIALFLLIAICFQLRPVLLARLSHARTNVTIAGTIVILLTLFALARTTHLEQVLIRWQSGGEWIANDARWQATRVAVGMLPDVGSMVLVLGLFASCFPITTWYRFTASVAPGGSCMRITCRPCWNGVGSGAVVGTTILWRNSGWDSQLQTTCGDRLVPAATLPPTAHNNSARWCRAACAGRFPASNRLDSTLRGDLSWPLLGKRIHGSAGKVYRGTKGSVLTRRHLVD